jgi:methyl-accepting chemotaxis protein
MVYSHYCTKKLSITTQNSAADMQEVSAATEEISASMEEVSASAEEIAASSDEMMLMPELSVGNTWDFDQIICR